MSLRKLTCGNDGLDRDELVALDLEARDDIAEKAAVHAIGFDSDESLFGLGHFGWSEGMGDWLRETREEGSCESWFMARIGR